MQWPRRWLALSLPLLMVCSHPHAHASASAQPAKLQQTQAELKATRAKADALAIQLKTTERELQSLRGDVTKVARDIQQREAVLGRSEARLRALSTNVREGEAALQQREARLQRSMLAMLQLQRLPPAAVFANPTQTPTMLRTAAALDAARTTLDAEAKALKQELAGLRRNKAALEVEKQRSAREAAALASKRSALTQKLSERSRLQASLSSNYASAEADAKRLAREAQSLQQLITTLNAAPKAPSSQPMPARGTPTKPVVGSVLHRFGEKKGNDNWRGMLLRTRPAALVVAPAGGEVAFTGPFMNYGSMVLLRHEGGMMSLLAGLGRIDVRLKQRLKAGEPLGIMPATGEQNLYVELRENAKPIDPSRWFATVGASLGH